jgi:hypothetical protein
LQVIRTYNVRDIVITLLGEADQWTTGENTFVMEFDSAQHKRPIDVGAPTLRATLPSTGSRPLEILARLARGNVPGRYIGTITLPGAGEWNVTVIWNSATANGSATFPVPATPRSQ